jgi:hypothetical protein
MDQSFQTVQPSGSQQRPKNPKYLALGKSSSIIEEPCLIQNGLFISGFQSNNLMLLPPIFYKLANSKNKTIPETRLGIVCSLTRPGSISMLNGIMVFSERHIRQRYHSNDL